jgi:uncharacterized protein YuzB (UPF0349 family)
MEQMKCPGQDTRFWKPGDIFVMECPKCGAEIEFFKDDTRRRCAWCGHLFYNPKIELGCAEWCQYAEKCVPDLVKEKKAAQTFKEILAERVKTHLEKDPPAWEMTEKGVGYAQDLLKAEGGDPKVVLAATLLHRVDPEHAREFLEELATEPEIADAVMALLTGQGIESDLNQQLFEDILTLLKEQPESHPHYATRTAQRLAAGG